MFALTLHDLLFAHTNKQVALQGSRARLPRQLVKDSRSFTEEERLPDGGHPKGAMGDRQDAEPSAAN